MFGALSMLVLSWWSIELHGNGNWPVLLVANMLINGYPIMIQRYNRVRVQAALALLTARPRAAASSSPAQPTHGPSAGTT